MATGSLQISRGKYYVVSRVVNENGEKKSVWIPTDIKVAGNNKREAQQRMREILTGLETKKVKYNRDILLADYIKLWLEEKKADVELNTWETYESYVNSIIEPYFRKHKIKLYDATPQDIKTFFSYLSKGDDKGKKRSAGTIEKYKTCINGTFKMAMENNLIAYNPVDRVKFKKPRKDDVFKGDFYTVEEANLLLDIFQKDALLPVVQIALFYGLRRSEILGLRWAAINFKDNTIKIERTVVKVKTLIDKKRTKNKSSLRTMPLMPAIKKMLVALKKEQIEDQLLIGSSYFHSDYVFRLKDGTPMKPDHISNRFRNVLNKNLDKIKKIRFHDLRHTTASLLISKGYKLQDIQVWLGHESIRSTEKYAHLQVINKVPMANDMTEILSIN